MHLIVKCNRCNWERQE